MYLKDIWLLSDNTVTFTDNGVNGDNNDFTAFGIWLVVYNTALRELWVMNETLR